MYLINKFKQNKVIDRLTFSNKSAALILILIITARMFGLFIATPILSVHLNQITDFSNSSVIWFGVAMGGYGLMQIIFQIPVGMLSDRLGRVPIIFYGLCLFIIGSVICEFARSVDIFAIGRLIQGMGAVSAASTALLSDLTPSENRIKWMALMGAGISLAFLFSFLLGPKIYSLLNSHGFFLIPAFLASISVLFLAFFPKTNINPMINSSDKVKFEKSPQDIKNSEIANPQLIDNKTSLIKLITNFELLHLNLGVFFLHASMIGIFVVIPNILTHVHGVLLSQQWNFYIIVVPLALILAFIFVWLAQGSKNFSWTFPIFVSLTMISLWLLSIYYLNYTGLVLLLLIYFFAFGTLEALQPSMVSKISSVKVRGTAMGIYHSFQSLGIFIGGFSSSIIYNYFGIQSVFLFNAALCALWLSVASYSYFIAEKNISINI